MQFSRLVQNWFSGNKILSEVRTLGIVSTQINIFWGMLESRYNKFRHSKTGAEGDRGERVVKVNGDYVEEKKYKTRNALNL